MVQDALNSLDPLADICYLLDGGKFKTNVHLQRIVPVVQNGLPIGRLHPNTVQKSVPQRSNVFGIVEYLVESTCRVVVIAISLSNKLAGTLP